MPWKLEMKYEIEKAKVKLKGLKDSVHKSISVMEETKVTRETKRKEITLKEMKMIHLMKTTKPSFALYRPNQIGKKVKILRNIIISKT